MGDGDDRPGWTEREKLTFSELDRRRRERRDGREPRSVSGKSPRRSEAVARQYLKKLDGLFGSPPASAEVERLAAAMRDAHGTAGLADACRAYQEAAGIPDGPGDLSIFLDAGDAELAVAALEAMRERHAAGALSLTSGLRTQVRMLAQDADGRVADAAEDLLDAL